MWFKQVTCDSCFKLLSKRAISNCYISVRYQDKKVLNTDMNYQEFMPYAEEYSFNYATFNANKPVGKLYICIFR